MQPNRPSPANDTQPRTVPLVGHVTDGARIEFFPGGREHVARRLAMQNGPRLRLVTSDDGRQS